MLVCIVAIEIVIGANIFTGARALTHVCCASPPSIVNFLTSFCWDYACIPLVGVLRELTAGY